jgi:hypothetical protein
MTEAPRSECSVCRDTGTVIDFDGKVTTCPDEACALRRLKQAAVELLGQGEARDPAIFKGGEFKMSMSFKGFELTDEMAEAICAPGLRYALGTDKSDVGGRK